MSLIAKGFLGAAFLVAADLAVAGLTGVTGLHSLIVDGGAALGQALHIPQPDWHGLFGLESIAHNHLGGAHDPISFTIK